MNRTHLASWAILVALAAAGCERAGTPEAFPQAAADGWLAAFNSGDTTGLALMYSDDAEVLPPDEPIVSGHAAIEEFWKSYDPGQVRIAVSEVETRRLGDYWFREGTYSAIIPEEGEPRIGKFIELWVKSGGAWLLYRHMWSPNAPPPAELPASAPG
ncbi:MAG: nuclear transport factor 2 family protein [Steroidobacteraceae bacterium]|nr:nuclear transport factor 2 family protein [Steroidobacteraceae bacterium]